MADEREKQDALMGRDDPFGSDEASGDEMVSELGESEDRMADTGTAFGPQEGGGGGIAPGTEDSYEDPAGGDLPTRGALRDVGPGAPDVDDTA